MHILLYNPGYQFINYNSLCIVVSFIDIHRCPVKYPVRAIDTSLSQSTRENRNEQFENIIQDVDYNKDEEVLDQGKCFHISLLFLFNQILLIYWHENY